MEETSSENIKGKRRSVITEEQSSIPFEDKLQNHQVADETQEMQSQQDEFCNTEYEQNSTIATEMNANNKRSDHDKILNKQRSKKNRELGDLNDAHILSARLRSSSGKVYSSGLSVSAASSQQSSPSTSLVTVHEEDSPAISTEEMCPKEGCCSGTAKLIDMMSNLQKSVDGVLKKVTTQETLTSNTSHRLQDLQERVAENEGNMEDIEKELKDTKFQLQVVSNIVIKQDEQISFLKQKISEIQHREMAANIVISGIPEFKNEKPLMLFNRFVEKGLELQELVPANRAFRIGSGQNRPLIVELRHPENKGKLFSSASKLKGEKNENGGSYFLSDHLPEDQNEKRRRINELISENKKKPTSHQLDMTLKKGNLLINEEPYSKSIAAPTAKDLLDPDEALYDKADELEFVRGGDDLQEKSKFISYAVAVQDLEDIHAAILKLRMKYVDATHVACAYRLPGANTPQNQDYVDDGEFGCGRAMLKVLKEEKYMNMAVFMVRFYGGKLLGVKRFEIFRNLTKSAITALIEKRK